MEQRRYFNSPETAIPDNITSIKRIMTGVLVTGYEINETTYSFTPGYSMVVTLPTDQPYSGVIGNISEDGKEFWTKDGIYLHKETIGSPSDFFVKDMLEYIPDNYQSSMINEITSDPTVLTDHVENLLKNTLYPKVFSVLPGDEGGIQDNISAYIDASYYLDSANDYFPYMISNIYGTEWVIPKTEYDAEAGISNGIRKDMLLLSNKLIYLLTYDGMLLSDNNNYLTSTKQPDLIRKTNIAIDGVNYQVYINLNYIYNESGSINRSLAENVWQVITIPGVFEHSALRGKIVKVW